MAAQNMSTHGNISQSRRRTDLRTDRRRSPSRHFKDDDDSIRKKTNQEDGVYTRRTMESELRSGSMEARRVIEIIRADEHIHVRLAILP